MKGTIAVVLSYALLPALSLAADHDHRSAKGTMSDQEFVDFAAQTDMMEAHIGQMTEQQADAQPVKEYGQMLVTDHSSDYKQLTAAAGEANLTVPKGLDPKHDKMIAPLEKLHGASFDRRFAHEMVAGHEAAIAVYKRESNDAQNAAIKTYATQALPTLEKHLTNAEALEKGHGK